MVNKKIPKPTDPASISAGASLTTIKPTHP